MIRKLLLDLDNTLIDSLPLLRRVYEVIVGHFDLEGRAPSFDQVKRLSIKEVAKLFPGDEEAVVKRYEKELEKEIAELKPGARPFLSFLRVQKIEVVLISSASRPWIEKHLSHHKIAHYFSSIVGENKAEAIEKAKPDEVILVDDDFPEDRVAIRLFRPDWNAIQKAIFEVNYEFIPLFSPIKMTPLVISVRPALSKEAIAVQEEVYRVQNVRLPHLFNGPVVYYEKREKEEIFYTMGEYKTLLGAAYGPFDLFSHISPMAVSAKVTYRDRYLVGKRSAATSVDPGLYELVPQGVLSIPDPERQILLELEEEAQIFPEDIDSIECRGLVFDRSTGLSEFVFRVELTTEKATPSALESEALFFASKEELFDLEENFTSFSHYLLHSD